MKATINPSAPNRALSLSPVKETINTTKIVGLLDGFITVLTEARFYQGRSASASTVYCSLWAGHQGGHGKASGHRYHKPSAALSAAINDAGITLTEPIDGYGEDAANKALLAIAQAIYPTATLVRVI